MSLRLFISQPMSDKSDDEILAIRQEAKAVVEDMLQQAVEVVESYFEEVPDNAAPLWYLTRSLLFLVDTDVVYFCKGWENYRGCRIERQVAQEYHIKIIDEPVEADEIDQAYSVVENLMFRTQLRYGNSENLTFAKQKLEVSQLWLKKAIEDGEISEQ